jgi:hypothetical protein
MDGQTVGRGEKLTIGSHDAARKVARSVQHARATRPVKGVGHLPRDAFEAIDQDRQLRTVFSIGSAPITT